MREGVWAPPLRTEPAWTGGQRVVTGSGPCKALVRERRPGSGPDGVFSLHRHASPTGLLLTVVVALIYMVAILYEE